MIINIIVGLTKSGKVRKVEKVMTVEEINASTLVKIDETTYVKAKVKEEVFEVLGLNKIEKEVQDMNNVVEAIECEIVDVTGDYVKYVKENVDYAIKYAIQKGKGAKSDVKFINAKQITAIFKLYKEIVGSEMSDNQQLCVKSLNPKQITNVIHTLNTSKKQFISYDELVKISEEFKSNTSCDLTKKELFELTKMSKTERLSYMRYTKRLVVNA